MENGCSNNGDGDVGTKPSDGSASIQANTSTKAPQKAKKQTAKAKGKKWTLKQNWQHANSAKRTKWIFEGKGGLIGFLILSNYVWQNLQTMWNFNAEHRPRVIFSRDPELLGVINCEITERAIYVHTGAMHIWMKNTGKGDAVNAFIGGLPFKLVPEKKTGSASIDEIPEISDSTCQAKASPKMKMFPVEAGQEIRLEMVQAMEAQSLIKTNSISITLGGPQKEPETPAGQNPEKIDVPKDALFQLYYPVCVYYFDEQGKRHATCKSYRLVTNSQGIGLGSTFSCTQPPISGSFEQTFGNFCEN